MWYMGVSYNPLILTFSILFLTSILNIQSWFLKGETKFKGGRGNWVGNPNHQQWYEFSNTKFPDFFQRSSF